MLPSAFAAPTPLWLPPGPAPLVAPTSRNTDGLSNTPPIFRSFSSTVAPAPTEGGEHPWHVEALLCCAAPPWLPPAEAGPVFEPPDAPPDDESPVLGPKGAFRCRRSCARRLEKLVASNGLHQLPTAIGPPPPHAARSRSHLGPRRPRSRHAARPRLYRLKSVFKHDHRSSGLLLPAAEQLASSTAVATEQTGGTTENANEAPVPGPKGTLSSSCVRVRVRAHAGRPLFVLRRPWRPPRGRFAPPYQLATAHHRRRAMPRTRSPRRPHSPPLGRQSRTGSGPHLFFVAAAQPFRSTGGPHD